MNACEDFLQLITQAHVFAAAMQHLHCSNVTELRTKITDQASMDSLTTAICTQYEEISMDRPSASRTLDRVQEYGKEALALGMLFLEFKDAIREGDGTRVLRCWKYFLSSAWKPPAFLCTLVSPFRWECWAARSANHPDKNISLYIMEGIRRGFRIGFNYSSHYDIVGEATWQLSATAGRQPCNIYKRR